MSTVECYQKENCPDQPRCILNFCPAGEAAVSPIGVVETCTNDSQCPKDHWCHDVSFLLVIWKYTNVPRWGSRQVVYVALFHHVQSIPAHVR